MPKPTFINLQKDKKTKFLAVALDEFALNDYDHASITRIVKVLNIAKGSVYQYFENKKDLYLYLLDQATRKRQEYVKPLLKAPPQDFYDLITQLFKKTIQFDIENPLYSRLLSNANNEKFSKDLGNAMLDMRKKSMDFMRGLLERELLMGGIRFDLNIDLASYLLAQMNGNILDFLVIQNKIDSTTLMSTRKMKNAISDTDIQSTARQISDFLKIGIKTEPKKGKPVNKQQTRLL
jgi:AcrR family transcriptional regulator